MPNQYQTVTPAMRREIAKLSKQGLSTREIGRKLRIDPTVALRYGRKQAPSTPEQIESGIRQALRRGSLSGKDLAAELGAKVKDVRIAIALMRERGVMIHDYPGDVYEMGSTAALEPGRHEIIGDPRADWSFHFGLVSDNHMCNRQSRLDVLAAAYDHFERRGIATVLNAGNYIDGEARFNKAELIVAPGMDNQIDYVIDKYPQRKGIKTLFIDGDDHEGWYAQREGIIPGQYLQMRAEKAGRHDLEYLGYSEADIALRCGPAVAVLRLLHPGGGSAYATSYTVQKIVESYQGGEKPQVLIAGHYHKAEYGYPREVHCIQAGCTQDQSLFMRKKKIAAHVGFWEIKLRVEEGHAIQCEPRWVPFYDRGFYERRFQ